MVDSILTSVKKLLGITENYEAFDVDIIIHINTVFSVLHQLGVGPDKPFSIQNKDAVWSDFTQDKDHIEMVKTYMYMKVKSMFDPPAVASALEAMNNLISEMEFRLNIADDPAYKNEEDRDGYST